MFDIIIKVVQTVLSGLGFFNKTNQDYYNSFIIPILADLKATHEDYLVSIKKYQTMINQTDRALKWDHPVETELLNDALYSAHIRNNLYALRELKDDKKIGNFIKIVLDYLSAVSLGPMENYEKGSKSIFSKHEYLCIANSARVGFGEYLANAQKLRINDQQRKELLSRQLRILTAELQTRYGKVMQAAIKLKAKLLLLSPNYSLKTRKK